MIAYNKTMYHYHIHNEYDKLWEPGNEIVVDKKFNMDRQKFIKQFSTGVFCVNPNGLRPLSDLIDMILPHIDSPEKLIELKDYAMSAYINNMSNIYYLLKDSSEIIKYAGIYNIETAMEEVREKYYNILPSRLSSLFVFDDEGMITWMDSYRNLNADLYEVSLTGNLFKTSAAFVPPFGLSHEEARIQSHGYWNPKFITEEEEKFSEYLFSGKAKVLRKINKEIE